MSSIIDNPSQLIKCDPFLPKVKFPVHKFSVHSTDWPVTNAAGYFRDLETLRPPENATDNDYIDEYIFRGIPESYPSDSKCCYLLNPIKYPPTKAGYNAFMNDLHSVHYEKYTGSTTRTYGRKKGSNVSELSRVKCFVIQCNFTNYHAKNVDKKRKKSLKSNVRMENINNSKKCSRGPDGRAMSRRSTSVHANFGKCGFKPVNLHVGKHCLFFLPTENVNRQHTNHPNFENIPTKEHVSESLKETIETVAAGKACSYNISKAITQLNDGNLVLTKGQAQYHSNRIRYKANVSDVAVPSSELNSSVGVAKVLQGYECRVVMLQHKHNSSDLYKSKDFPSVPLELLETFQHGSITHTGTQHITYKQIQEWIDSERPNSKQDHAVAISWVSKAQYNLARAFGHTFHIDATHKVCVIDNLLMLTTTVRDRFCKTYVVGRFWIPNQRMWMFQYILCEAIPSLLGSFFCQNVRAIVSDGDVHLTRIIDGACNSVYPKAVRIGCSWHLSDRTINTANSLWHLKRNISMFVKEWFCRFLQKWLGTFMIPGKGIETKDEYSLSKALLIGVVNCETMSKCFVPDTIKAIIQFLNEKIFVHEGSYLAYEKKKLFNMEQHSNSAHEGTNNAIKSSGDGLHARDSLVGATNKCSTYDRNRLGWREKEVSRLFLGVTRFSDEFAGVTKHIVGVLQNQKRQAQYYKVDIDIRDSGVEFYVMNSNPFWELDKRMDEEIEQYLGHCDDDDEVNVINEFLEDAPLAVSNKRLKKMPTSKVFEKMSGEEKDMIRKGESALSVCRFLHVRKVSVKVRDGSLLMFCDCCMDDRCGTICRHKFAVFSKYLEPIGFQKFDHTGVHCINWNSYHYYGMMDEEKMTDEEKRAWKTFQHHVQIGFDGTKVKHHLQMSIPNLRTLLEKSPNVRNPSSEGYQMKSLKQWYESPAHERVTNFSRQFIKQCMEDHLGRYHDSVKYTSQLSQADFEVDDSPQHALEQDISINKFSEMIAIDDPDSQTVPERQQTYQHFMYELKNQFDFNNASEFSNLMKELIMVKTKVTRDQQTKREKNSTDVFSQKGGNAPFPNTAYGRKSKSKRE